MNTTSTLWLSSPDHRGMWGMLLSVLVAGKVQPGRLIVEALGRIKGGIRSQKVEDLVLREMEQLQT